MGKEGGWQFRFVLITVVLAAAIWAGNEAWKLSNSPERQCEKARWVARGGWDEAAEKLMKLHKRLVADKSNQADRTPIQRPGSITQWRMWQSAQEMAEIAVAQAYANPKEARNASMEASRACRVARESSPTVYSATVGENDRGREYTPGGGAVRACSKAAEESEKAWEACSFEVAELEQSYATTIDIGFNFFRGCGN